MLAAYTVVVNDVFFDVFVAVNLIPLNVRRNFIFLFAGDKASLTSNAVVNIDEYSVSAHDQASLVISTQVSKYGA